MGLAITFDPRDGSNLAFLTHYCGTADRLGESVPKILRGEEVVVPAIVGGNKEDLEQRRDKIRDVRVQAKPDIVGKVQALSADGKGLKVLPAPTALDKSPAAIEIQIADATRVVAIHKTDTGKLAVGETVKICLKIGDGKIAATVQVGKVR